MQGLRLEFNKEYELGDFIYISNEKIDAKEISLQTYVTTENMLVNRGGIEKAKDLPNSSKFNRFYKNDTLFSNIRTYFRKVWLASFNGGASADVLVFKAKNETALNPLYLYYLISDKKFSDYSVLTSKGVKMPRGDKIAMLQYKFLLQKLDVQNKCVKIFKALDDKIENNQRMNKTLEAMAQAIFKSWFVDFEPVYAKAEVLENGGSLESANLAAMQALSGKTETELQQLKTKDPKKYAELENTAKAFPSHFISSPLGDIPKGWEVKEFGTMITPKKGKSITKKTIIEGLVPVVAGGLEPAYYHNTPNAEAPVITISASGANAGFIRLYQENIWASDCSYINENQTKFIFSIYSLLKFRQSEIFSMQQGAAQPHIYPSDIMRLIIVDAPNIIWELCEKYQKHLYCKIKQNELENQTLATTRDALLPKLLNGEIDLSNIKGE